MRSCSAKAGATVSSLASSSLRGITARGCPRLDPLHDEIFRALDRLGAGRFGFNDENVAIGKRIERARVLKPGRDRVDLQVVRNAGPFSFFQPTTDATCMGGRRYCCGAGSSGLVPICVLGSDAVSLQPLRSDVLHSNPQKNSLR